MIAQYTSKRPCHVQKTSYSKQLSNANCKYTIKLYVKSFIVNIKLETHYNVCYWYLRFVSSIEKYWIFSLGNNNVFWNSVDLLSTLQIIQ